MKMSAQETLPKKETKKGILKINQIWKSFKTGDKYTTILKEITTDIQKGEFVMLFGPSGCGKSTLLNTLMGLEHPDKGSVNFMGFDIWSLSSDDRAVIRKKNIGIVYQQQNWIKAMNVVDNVALIGSLLGLSKKESHELALSKLELVGMTHRAEYKPYELSSGEQQRINLARSLMSDPALIIADEPTGNLDVKSGIKVMQIFRDLADSGKTILMVTHNPESLDFSDRILFMIDGKIRKDIEVTEEKIGSIKDRINKDLEAFINEAELAPQAVDIKTPAPVDYKEDLGGRREKFTQILNFIKFNLVFTLSMFLILLLYLPVSIVEKLFRRRGRLSEAIKDFILNIFNVLEGNRKNGGIEKSISDWDLGEISLSHLMEKKSRSLITVLGVGIGIGFITFLLSIGYGLESLVVGEIAEIEEMRQVEVTPMISSEVVLDEEKLEIISSTDGISKVYPLINVATTIYYKDSQTDVVAYGVDPEYFSVIRNSIIQGESFNAGEEFDEMVVSEDVLAMLGMESNTIIKEEVNLGFIPIGEQADEEDAYTEIDYTVSGVLSSTGSPVIYVPIEDVKSLGVEQYSQLLLVLEDNADMSSVRRDIEVLGMKTSSIMDTVSQIEEFFTYFRLALTVVGTVAFVIAILGMINTLTISLLERTREVGLLKSIGMRSNEIRKLFVTEAMIISFSGGVSGIFLGSMLGFISSLILSFISISQGGEYMSISRVPIYMALGIVLVSVTIGFITGLYPSRRAVRMSPLDALRYE